MDGAIILDESVSRILAANVQLAPDPSLPTNEKRAKLILEGIQQMRNRRNYH
jgi:DNA integrity scanning protein DisA with diadenylate cyclase activity